MNIMLRRFFWGERRKKIIISNGDGASIIIQPHFDLTDGPHPFLRNLPYGAEIKNRRRNTTPAKQKISVTE
jgi:hypothetical protein